ncbi:MAG: hypothetical protein AB7P67_07695 [Vicinamibacterales bacterium]|jgi:hypothetical protein
MDTAVALVQAYLQVNGYFTVAEYPVLEARRGQARSVTDLDMLAFRFAHPGHDVKKGRGRRPLTGHPLVPDPVLGCPADQPDMIVGEVKEGSARFNAAARDPVVLEVALARFGCCERSHVGQLTQQLLAEGRAVTPAGHTVRMVAFGEGSGITEHAWTCVPMRHVVEFLQAHLREHWEVLRHAQIREPAFGVLALIEKWGVRPAVDAGRPRPLQRRPDGSM